MLKRLWNGMTGKKSQPDHIMPPAKPIKLAEANTRRDAGSTVPEAANSASEAPAVESAESAIDDTDDLGLEPAAGMIVELEIAPGIDALDSRASLELLTSFHNDLTQDRFRLSSLPDTAMRVRQLLSDPDIQINKLADVIGLDPAIATKLIRVSNSALYVSNSKCETIQTSVLRLGFNMTRQIATSFAMNDLLQQCPAELSRYIREYWEHSIRVSAIAYVLAKRTGVCSAEEALLAGILSNIGVFSVFNYLGNHADICEDRSQMEASINSLKAEVGALVLDKWEFSEELVACARHCEDWEREHSIGDCADLCDLVLVATLHAYIGKRKLPSFDEVPAFNRLSGGQLTAETAMDFMRDAQAEIQQAMNLFYGN